MNLATYVNKEGRLPRTVLKETLKTNEVRMKIVSSAKNLFFMKISLLNQ